MQGHCSSEGRNGEEHLLALPAYDQCIKASHIFNLLDARGVISVTERQSYILRVRELAKSLLRRVAKNRRRTPMINDTALGLIVAAVPLLIIGFLALRRLPAVFAFFVVLLAVGLGYLETTGAVRDFGHKVRATLPAGMLPAHKSTPPSDASTTTAPAMAPAEPAPAANAPCRRARARSGITPPPSNEPAPATPAPANP